MVGRIKRKISMLKFKLKLRKALEEETDECLYWTLEEVKREINIRNNRKKQL